MMAAFRRVSTAVVDSVVSASLPYASCYLMTTDDLARWELCGIPSAWRSPTARCSGGSPRRDRRRSHVALPPGRRVVALREVERMSHPAHPAQPQQRSWSAIPEACPPGEGMVWLDPGCVC